MYKLQYHSIYVNCAEALYLLQRRVVGCAFMIFMHELMKYMRNLCVFVIQCYKTFDLAHVSQDKSRVWSTYVTEQAMKALLLLTSQHLHIPLEKR